MYWMDDSKGKDVLLFAGFGTSDPAEMERTYGNLMERARARYPGMRVLLALTAPRVIERLYERTGERPFSLEEALQEAPDWGEGEIFLVPVQVLKGREYEKVCQADAALEDQDRRVRLYEPLLHGYGLARMRDMLLKEAPKEEDTAQVYVGHGTALEDRARLSELQERLCGAGRKDILIGDLHAGPEALLGTLAERGFREVCLHSFMMTAGHHWEKHIAGEGEGSWKCILARAGFTVRCRKKSLLEREEVLEMLLDLQGR